MIDLAAQLQSHLESLHAAGVLFVPRGETFAPIAPPSPVAANPATVEVAPSDPSDMRRQSLSVLATEVAACHTCDELYSTRTQTVFGTGPLEAEVAFVGDGPGVDEDAQGEPFVGKGGQLLTRIIAACGFTRDSVYLFNLIKCRTPKKRTPTATECENCRVFFDRQFDLLKPKHLVALGQFASRVLTGNTTGRLRGAVHSYRGVPLICTHHPNDIEQDRSGAKRRETWDDMKMLLNLMGRPVPAK